MNARGMLAAADAVFDAARALRRAAETVDELSDVAASSLRVLDDAATDAFYAHQEERRDFHLESAGEHLTRLRHRSEVMNELGDDLTRHLTTAGNAIELAGTELGRSTDANDRDADLLALHTQIDVLGEVVALARPVADQITRHAQHAAESAAATDAFRRMDDLDAVLSDYRPDSEIRRTKWETTSIRKIAALPKGFMSSRPEGSQLARYLMKPLARTPSTW